MLRMLVALAVFLVAAPSWAASPVVLTTADTADEEGLTTVLNMPSGIVAGDLLLAECSHFSGTTILSESGTSTWTIIDSGNYVGQNVTRAVFAKIASGSDTLTTAGFTNGDTACGVIRIGTHTVSNVATDIVVGTVSSANTSTPDPPAVNPGVSKDWLVLANLHISTIGDSTTINAFPSTYTSVVNILSSASSGVRTGVGRLAVTASSEDPGTYTISLSRNTHAQTLMIPGTVDGGGFDSGSASHLLLLEE